MLHYETIEPKTLGLLRKLQKIPEFANVRLVGGTALALQIGHRKSIDIDLFGIINSDNLTISKRLDDIGSVTVLKKSDNINIYIIDEIKVDIVNYHYKWIADTLIENNIRLADKKDILAMKLAAITGRGSKKDFVDLFYLLQHFTLEQAFDFYSQKYHDGSVFLVLKSLSYFEDAEQDENPLMLETYNWDNIKATINTKTKEYIKNNYS